MKTQAFILAFTFFHSIPGLHKLIIQPWMPKLNNF